MAMEARCYHGGEGRTRLRVLKLSLDDLLAALGVAILLVLILAEPNILPKGWIL